ncbi:MAG: hypothetical protein B7C24_05995 [Bacteroidetes bacterium 4572_77]|nr:MAG: hypothetical protein B7C24_05995 [Bacteroidetes bacterium 4572_77]
MFSTTYLKAENINDSLVELADSLMQQSEIKQTLDILSLSSIDSKSKISYHKLRLKKAEILITIGEYEKALPIIFSVINQYQPNKRTKILIDAYNKLGKIDLELRDYHFAASHFNQAVESTPSKLDKSDLLAGIYNNLGIVYHKTEKYDSALRYYQKAESIFF